MKASKQAAFTLLEVLIGMSLLSVMMLLLFASLRTCVQSWNAGEKKIAEVSQAAIVQNFLQSKLHSALPLEADFLEEPEFSFQGDAEQLQFVAPMAASAGRLGLQLFKISLGTAGRGEGQQLQVDMNPFFPQSETEQWNVEQVVILKKIHRFKLAYFGADEEGGEPAWQDDWLDRGSLPKLVSISVELLGDDVWPQLVVALKVSADTNSTSSRGRRGLRTNPFAALGRK